MRKSIRIIVPQMLLALGVLTTYVPEGFAQGSYGSTVNDFCTTFNGTQPYTAYQLTPEGTADKCTYCHQAKPAAKSVRKDPEWTWWQNQLQVPSPLTNFCPPQTNQAPDGVINAPANNTTVSVGIPVQFTGSGSDPDNNTPLTYAWNFGGGATNSTAQSPSVTFNTAGTFTITLTVTDSLGRADPTPAISTIIVIDPNANQAPNGTITSPSGNTSVQVGQSISFAGTGSDPEDGQNSPLFGYSWNFGGAATNSTAQNPSVLFNTPGIFSVMFTVTDSKGLSDPAPATLTINVGTTGPAACIDQDKDGFSGKGGVCGPVDCDDFNAAVNPGAIEACGDNVDNDCNGNIDGNDAQCKGSSCIGDLLKQIEITSASWKQEDRELKVKGYWSTAGAIVKLSDALTGVVLGTTRVSGGKEHEDEEHEHEGDHQASTNYEWKFELEHLAMAPCRVRVEIDGRYGERDVAYAPANCSGKPPATNKPPVANDDNASTTEKTPVSIAVLANDTDADKDTLTIVVFTQPKNGVVTKKDEVLTYRPKPGFNGTDSFTYTISDHHGGTAKANVNVTVKANSVPFKVNISSAQWNSKDKKLSVSGSGAPKKSTVRILNATTKATIGNTQAQDNGKWSLTIQKPSAVPCKVGVEITSGNQKGYAEKKVSNAPKTCK